MVKDDRPLVSRSRTRIVEQRQMLRRRALRIVNRYTLLSGGLGLIPTPLFYQLAVGGLLSKMLYELSELYGTSLSKQKNKVIIATILSGAHAEWISVYFRSNVTKLLPGTVIGNTVVRPVVAAAITYSVGKLFVIHFESGAWLKETSAPSVPHVPAE